jgi:hypothetical protein
MADIPDNVKAAAVEACKDSSSVLHPNNDTDAKIGGLSGVAAGAAVGAGIGAFFGGVGAIPGAAIGAAVGGISGIITGGFMDASAQEHCSPKATPSAPSASQGQER